MSYEILTGESVNSVTDETASADATSRPTRLSRLVTSMSQLKLLFWKNWTLQKRSLIACILELLIPALFAFILLPIRRIVKSDHYLNDTVFPAFRFDQLPPQLTPEYSSGFNLWSVAYQPNNSQLVDRIMSQVGKSISVDIKGFENEDDMVAYSIDKQNFRRTLCGVSFVNTNLSDFRYKLRFSYSPRFTGQTGLFKHDMDWKTGFVYWLFPILGPREKNSMEGGDPGYYREGFIAVQKAIDMALVSEYNKTLGAADISLKRFSYPPYDDDKFVAVIAALFPFIIMLSFVFTVIITAKSIVHEKETGLKEAMRLMGMKSWIYWLSWYLKTLLLLLPAIIFMSISFKIRLTLTVGDGVQKAAIMDKSNGFLFFLFLLLYVSSSITFTFMCTAFFKKANSAAAGVGIIWFFSYLPYLFISLRYSKMNLVTKLLAALLNNLAMSEGVQLIGIFEAKGTGVNFSNWTQGPSVDDDFSLFLVMCVMFFLNFVHLTFLYYFENVMPGDHGLAKPWYFPIYSLLPKRERKYERLNNETRLQGAESDDVPVFIEDEPSNRPAGVRINSVSKSYTQFGVEKKAVTNFSLNIYQEQITVLLGHNGAGKSTLISMICGLQKPSLGTIHVNDVDMVAHTSKARKFIGLCPQHNLLFADLTVYEHLRFFGKLKGDYSEIEVNEILEMINLNDKRDSLASTLSGGMKRKLSIAIAFIGHPNVVILDEPTSGMDPQARHSTWSLLQKFKNERKCNILLTTHFLDEADFLGDRIAIMSQGHLKCCGSPLFLKSKYGSGYKMTLTKQRNTVESNIDNQEDQLNRLVNLVQNMVPSAKLSSNINSEISFILPREHTQHFARLFDQLEKQKEAFNILNIGISITTLEDVFLRIDDRTNLDDSLDTISELDDNDEFGLWSGSKSQDRLSGFRLTLQQFQALFVKRIINTFRNKTLILSQLIIPIAALLINLIYLKYAPIKPEDSPALEVSLSRYSQNYVPVLLNENDELLQQISKEFKLKAENSGNAASFVMNATNNELASKTPFKFCSDAQSSIDQLVGCVGRKSFNYIIDNLILGADFTRTDKSIQLVGHFNNQPFHVPPLIVNFLTNSLLNIATNSTSNKITVINHPLPRNLKDELNDLEIKDMTGFNVATGLTFGFSFLIASFAVFLIKERSSGSKHLQYLSGCSSNIFWISAFIWDMLSYTITFSLAIIILKLFGINEFVGENRWSFLLGLFLLYGLAHIPNMYLMAYMFQVSATGFAILVGWNILTSQVTLTIVQILSLPQLQLVYVSEILEWIFLLLLPNFSIGQSLIDLYNNYQITNICQDFVVVCPVIPNPCCVHYNTTNPNKCGAQSDCLLWDTNYLAWDKPGLMRFFIFLPIQFVLLFGVILIYEADYFSYIKYKIRDLVRRSSSPNVPSNEMIQNQLRLELEYGDIPKDEDVVNEEHRIARLVHDQEESTTEILVVDRLTKFYSNFMAVKGISFSLGAKETFGLLGVNGAGKTTTFKMITGDEICTRGDAYIGQISLRNNIKKFRNSIGYCPQFDPLIDQMTVLETTMMFARLRGLKPAILRRTCISLISLLNLTDHMHKMCYTLSGGNKRKLSVALSLIGSPQVILLDEPTSGMDPKTRRILWTCLNTIRHKGKSLILTTHSMDETEALATNIGIMVNGELKCLGSLQHLKSKYGEGYTLLAKIAASDEHDKTRKIGDFVTLILTKFNNTTLKESRDGFINIHINNNSTHILSAIFALVETVKERFNIEYYVVTQTKLEQIFLNFASRQIDPESRMIQGYCCSC